MKRVSSKRLIAIVLVCGIVPGMLMFVGPTAGKAPIPPTAEQFKSNAESFMTRAMYLRFMARSGGDSVLADANVNAASGLLGMVRQFNEKMRSFAPAVTTTAMKSRMSRMLTMAEGLEDSVEQVLKLRQDAATLAGTDGFLACAGQMGLQDAAEKDCSMMLRKFKTNLAGVIAETEKDLL